MFVDCIFDRKIEKRPAMSSRVGKPDLVANLSTLLNIVASTNKKGTDALVLDRGTYIPHKDLAKMRHSAFLIHRCVS